jgi:RNA polymerase sigma-70 factor, ECF subfamily
MSIGPSEFRRIHETFHPRVVRYLTRLLGRSDAEDVAQMVMLKVSEGLRGFRGEAGLSTWIYRVATNAALDRLRVRHPEDGGDPLPREDDAEAVPPEAQSPSAEATVLRGEMSACIRAFVEALPANYRTVMVLAEIEGFTNAETAQILGISIDAVKIRLHRARAALRRDLEAGCAFDHDERRGLACDRKSLAARAP